MRRFQLGVFLLLSVPAAIAVAGCGRTTLSGGGGTERDAAGPDARDGGVTPCRSDVECDDGLVCNGAERCSGGRCVAGAIPSCEDRIPCTADTCDRMLDRCTHTPDSSRCGPREICDPMLGCRVIGCVDDSVCQNGFVCDGIERCLGGTCIPGPPLDCNDGVACTIDLCDESLGGCFNVPQDRDGDGFTDPSCGGDDCDDSNPTVFPGAFEVCTNMVDDDCDFDLDCDDASCASGPPCSCTMRELCGAMMDADCDGFFDCMDSDCAADPACRMPCRFVELDRRIGPRVAVGTTVGAIHDFTATCTPGSTAEDRLYRWTAPATGTYAFDTFGSSYDTVLYVLQTCFGPEVACDDDTMGVQSLVTLSLRTGDTILIVVDGFGTSAGQLRAQHPPGHGDGGVRQPRRRRRRRRGRLRRHRLRDGALVLHAAVRVVHEPRRRRLRHARRLRGRRLPLRARMLHPDAGELHERPRRRLRPPP
jgi:hypothetical protein